MMEKWNIGRQDLLSPLHVVPVQTKFQMVAYRARVFKSAIRNLKSAGGILYALTPEPSENELRLL